MKTFKKIGIGLALAVFLAGLGLILNPQKGSAASGSNLFKLSYATSTNEIIGNYNNKSFVFSFDQGTAATSKWIYTLTTSGGPICPGSSIDITPTKDGNFQGPGTPDSFKYKPIGSSTCKSFTQTLAISAASTVPPSGGPTAPPDKIDWTGAKGVLNADSTVLTVTFSDGSQADFTDNNPGPTDQTPNFKPSSAGHLGGAVVASWCSNTLLANSGGDPTFGISLASFTAKSGTVKICYKDSVGNTINQTGISIPVDTSAYLTAQQVDNANATCSSQFDSPFAWAICPALDMADSAAGVFNKFVENQMCFNTGSVSSTGGVVCGGQNNLNDGVHRSWTVFRNIATVLLIIVMLVMVISQAIGGGPFDAYTVRKLLPKIVVAVIVMQLSWVLFKWLIDLSNDAGIAIRDIMFAPFGGGSKLQLDHIIGTSFGTHTTGTNDTFAFFTVLAGVGAAFIVSIPTLALLGLYVVLALLTAFIVLIFRKLLLVLLVITAPLALVAWILPGTERYWKLWSENFTKLLLMFPMIMGLIGAGRIFASITSGTTASMFSPHPGFVHLGPLPIPSMGSITSFVDLAIIIVAYFAPYFLLPQTYKWGGAAMGAIAKGVKSGVEKGASPANEYLKWRQGLSPWRQARAARRAKQELRAKTDFYGGLSAEGTRGRVRRARLGGIIRPTPAGVRDERALRDSIVSGGRQRAEEEALKEAQQALQQELGTNPDALADHDQYVIDIALAGPGANIHGRIRSEADWRAATEQLIQYGGPNNRVMLELHARARASGGEERVRWEKVINALAPTILPKFPMLYKDSDYSERDPVSHALGDIRTTVVQLTPESFTKAGIEGEAVETILGHLSSQIREGATPGASVVAQTRGTEARRLVETMYSLFNQTVTNEATRGNVNPASARAMLSAAGANPAELARINAGRGAPGVPIIEAPVINHAIVTSTDPDIPAAISSILANVRPDGNPR